MKRGITTACGRWPAAVAAAVIAASWASASDPDTIAGVARVVDGDTLEIRDEYVRLIGIDAPERDHPAGPHATAAMRELVGDGDVACDVLGRDWWERALAVCRAGGKDLARALVRAGWAEALYPRGGVEGPDYERAEAEARRRGIGIWSDRLSRPAPSDR